MTLQENYFTYFKQSIDSYTLPEKFTFPFYYQPHPLCLLAAKELQNHLERHEYQHNFGLTANNEGAIGKMFGVLLVQNKDREIGYLAAFSGKLGGKNQHSKFVPAVFNMLDEDGFFMAEELAINQLNEQISNLEKNPQLIELKASLESELNSSIAQIKTHRERMIEERQIRKEQRITAAIRLNNNEFLLLKEHLSKQSIKQKNQLKELNNYWDDRLKKAQRNLNQLTDKLTLLKVQRKDLSASLQKKLFDQYHFLNSKGISKSLCDIFKQTSQLVPPAGAGECAAPKLLQYAFKWEMKPLALAEFWWGSSPKSELRKHLKFYAACLGKCQPILKHMLEGVKMDENPLLTNPARDKPINIVYEDENMLLINKPAGLLSEPGKNIEDSVYLRIKQSYPGATGPLIVHRLDMSTSGLMLIALSKQVHKNLQQQFIKRSIKKRYLAVLDGLLKEDEGMIDLPLRNDYYDRPRQLVCYQHGKPARTQWKVIERKNNTTKVYFFPITGRSHQLRVHSAHVKGLNMPIVGDELYGTKSKRLHLQAQYLEFNHPITKERVHFEIEADF